MRYLASIEWKDGTYSFDVQTVDDDEQYAQNPFFSTRASTPSDVRSALEALCEGVPERIDITMNGAAYVALGINRVGINKLVLRHNNPERYPYLRS